MTRHLKTNEKAIEAAGQVLTRLDMLIPETEKEIEYHREMIKSPKMSDTERTFYEAKIKRLENNKPYILKDIAAVESAREKLSNPERTWYGQDQLKIEKLATEQRRIIGRMIDNSYTWQRGFLRWSLLDRSL